MRNAPRESTAISPNLTQAQETALRAIAGARAEIAALAREIHADPEAPFEEQRAAERLTAFLEQRGFAVQRGQAGLPTAFVARRARLDREQMRKGLRHPEIALLAEYDAVPRLGHARGHHLVAGAALATALGLAAASDVVNGIVSVVGCPGSGERGGKLALADSGVFEQFDAAFGAHPAPTGRGAIFTINSSGNTLASASATVAFHSTAGRDATPAVEQFARAVETLGPDLIATDEVNLSVGNGGLALTVRATTAERVEELLGWLRARAATAAAEQELNLAFDVTPICPEMVVSRVLIRRVRTHSYERDLWTDDVEKSPPGLPVDWGAVSRSTPTADCWFPVTTEPVEWDTPEFVAASATPAAFAQMFGMAEAMALTGVDLLTDLNLRSIADNELVRAMKERGVTRNFRRWTGVHRVLPKSETDDNR